VERDLTELLEREIRWHSKMEIRKQEMSRRYDWSASASFNAIDSIRLGYVEHRHIADFLKRNGHYATESELIAIVRRLDVDADQRITFDEWAEAIRPSSFSPQSSLAPPAAQSHGASPMRRAGEEESKGSPVAV